jgi:putative transposase
MCATAKGQKGQGRLKRVPQAPLGRLYGPLAESVAELFSETAWQRCVVHWYRNVFSHVPLDRSARGYRDAESDPRLRRSRTAQRAVRVIEMPRGLRLITGPNLWKRRLRTRLPITPSRKNTAAHPLRAFSDGRSVLNLSAAGLHHIADTAWSSNRYLNIELLKDQKMRGAIIA